MYVHWSWRSSASDVELPGALLDHAACAAKTKPMPGGPSTHLPDAAMSASNGVARGRRSAIARERAHRVDDQAPVVAGHDGGDLGQRIQDAGRRFAMDEPDVRDRRVAHEQAIDVCGGRAARPPAVSMRRQPPPHHLGQLRHPLAVGAVDQHQHDGRRAVRAC